MKIRFIIIVVAVSTLVLAAVPFASTCTPGAVIRVVDEAGKPVSDVAVNRNWWHYGLKRAGNSYLKTGPTGEAVFPPEKGSGNFYSRGANLLHDAFPGPHSRLHMGSLTVFAMLCPPGYEPSLSQPDFTTVVRKSGNGGENSPVSPTGEFGSCRSREGDNVFIDYRQNADSGGQVHLTCERASPIELTLRIKRARHQSP